MAKLNLYKINENTFTYKANPRAIVTIIQGSEAYVITFGSAYFLVDKFCNRKLAFEFAKRSEYSNIKTTALNAPNSHNPKVDSSSLSPATKTFTRVARDCRLLFFFAKYLFLQKWGQFGDSPYIFMQ